MVYHVLNRGNGRMRIFHKGEDFEAFERVLSEGLQRYPVDLFTYCLMPNHDHAIVQFRGGASLKTISESWMRFTARKINAATGRRGAYWQPEPFDHIIRSPEQFVYLQRYTADNPKKAHLRPGEFLYWERPRV